MIRACKNFYTFLVLLPNRLYPFSFEVEGKRVRGRRSYDATLLQVRARLGPGSYGARILIYREVFHLVGSLSCIALATFLSQHFFGSEIALYVLLGTAALVITIQEFYLHPRYYNQHFAKGMTDWLTWVVPIGFYLFFIL